MKAHILGPEVTIDLSDDYLESVNNMLDKKREETSDVFKLMDVPSLIFMAKDGAVFNVPIWGRCEQHNVSYMTFVHLTIQPQQMPDDLRAAWDIFHKDSPHFRDMHEHFMELTPSVLLRSWFMQHLSEDDRQKLSQHKVH